MQLRFSYNYQTINNFYNLTDVSNVEPVFVDWGLASATAAAAAATWPWMTSRIAAWSSTAAWTAATSALWATTALTSSHGSLTTRLH